MASAPIVKDLHDNLDVDKCSKALYRMREYYVSMEYGSGRCTSFMGYGIMRKYKLFTAMIRHLYRHVRSPWGPWHLRNPPLDVLLYEAELLNEDWNSEWNFELNWERQAYAATANIDTSVLFDIYRHLFQRINPDVPYMYMN